MKINAISEAVLVMNCLENGVCSVKKENNLGYYRLHTIWKNDGFFLNVASRDGAWRGEMTANDVKRMSNQLDMEADLYLKHCKEVLTHPDGQPGISYSVENGNFTWKKIVDEDSGIKIKMGSIMLQPASFVDTIQNFVSAALDCNKKLLQNMKELSKEKEKNVSNRTELLNKLDELIKTKDAMENDLYSKFISLLNAKKEKIEELESLLKTNRMKNKKVRGIKNTVEMLCANSYEIDTEIDECDTSDTKPQAYTVRKTKRRSTRLQIKNAGDKKSCQSGGSSKEAVDENLPSSSNGSQNLETLNKEKGGMPSTKSELLDFFYSF